MKTLAVICTVLLSTSSILANSNYSLLLDKAYKAADAIYDGKESLSRDQITNLDTLYDNIQFLIEGAPKKICSSTVEVYKLAYKWAYETWRSVGKATDFAESTSARCHGDLYLEAFSQAYTWSYSVWRSMGSSESFSATIADYEELAQQKLSCYKDAYTWAFDTWRSTGKSKAHAEKMCFED